MKKNVMMRLASGLLVAVLLTTCAISGTYAKYVTTESASDTARVAKWGVGITTFGNLFGEQYKDEIVEAGNDTMTVQVFDAANVEENVVAPGTQNSTGMTFTLTGRPEVDVKLDVAVTVTDIKLPAGTYADPTTGNSDPGDTFTLAEDYYPVVFTLKNGAGATLASGNLATIESYLVGLSRDKIDSNTDLDTNFLGTDGTTKTDGTYNLTWAWAFEGAQNLNGHDFTATQVDQADTYLGNQATPQTIKFGITITATQIN